jgi:HEAT repeat protein
LDMYQIPIHPIIKYSRHFLCVGLIITFIGIYNPLTYWLAAVGTIIFIVGFVLQIYLNRVISKFRVKSSLGVDFLFSEIDNWIVAAEFVAMPEEKIPTETDLSEEEIQGYILTIQMRKRKRRDAANSLAIAGPKVIPYVLPLFEAEHPELRHIAASILRYLGSRGVEALPTLIDALDDSEEGVRAQVICTLARMGPPAAKALPQLDARLEEASEDIRVCTALAIGRVGKNTKISTNIIKNLQKLQEDLSPSVQVAATIALDALSEGDDQTATRLIQGLHDRNAVLALLASEAIGLIGEPAKDAIPDLVEALKTQHPIIHIKVAHALYRLGYDPMALLRPILQAARTGEVYVRLEALEILKAMGPDAKMSIQAYVRMLSDKNTLTRVVAIRGISFLGEEARSLVPQIRKAVSDPAKAVRYHAELILKDLGEPIEVPEEIALEASE